MPKRDDNDVRPRSGRRRAEASDSKFVTQVLRLAGPRLVVQPGRLTTSTIRHARYLQRELPGEPGTDGRGHDLRHTWASWHVQAGTPLHALQELGGWECAEMVRRYAHLSSEHLAVYAERMSGTTTATTTNVTGYDLATLNIGNLERDLASC